MSLRCEVCGTTLTDDNYCYPCGHYRLGKEIRDIGGRILSASDYKQRTNHARHEK